MDNSNKQSAQDFLTLVVNGKIDEAYEKYIDMNGKHHNLYFAGDFTTLKEAMEESQKERPDKKFTIKHVVGDGDMVAVHSHLLLKPDTPGMITLHMFRFENDKIVEMWDFGQEIPKDSPNQNGAF